MSVERYYSRGIGYTAGYPISFENGMQKCEPQEDGLHITRVVVNAGGTIYQIDADGLRVYQGEPTDRGVSVFTQFCTETGDHFERHEQFHKGAVMQEIRYIGHTSPFDGRRIPAEGVPVDALTTRTIWRD